MAFTYEPSGLTGSALWRARFQLGDVLATSPLLQDEEIGAMIEMHGYTEGVAQCADALAVKYAQEPDEYEDEGGVKVKWSQKVQQWIALAKRLREGVSKPEAVNRTEGAILAQTIGPDMSGLRF